MQYISLIYEYAEGVESLSEEQHQVLIEQHNRLQARAKKERAYLGASELKPASSAVSVRVRNGVPSITDGPFTESKELFVGFYLFDCPDLDDALRWASMIPTASNSGVEVRPVDNVDCSPAEEQTTAAFSLEGDKALFALLNYLDEDLLEAYSAKDTQGLIAENAAMAERARAAGDYVSGNKLMSPATATSIHHANHKQRIIDGPFSEAKEVLLGLHIVACQSAAEALDYARSIPDASAGVVEVRPINFHEQQGPQPIRWNSSAAS